MRQAQGAAGCSFSELNKFICLLFLVRIIILLYGEGLDRIASSCHIVFYLSTAILPPHRIEPIQPATLLLLFLLDRSVDLDPDLTTTCSSRNNSYLSQSIALLKKRRRDASPKSHIIDDARGGGRVQLYDDAAADGDGNRAANEGADGGRGEC